MRTHTEQAQMHQVCVRGNVVWFWHWWMICQINVPLMPSSPFAQKRKHLYLCVGGKTRGYHHMCSCLCGCVQLCLCTAKLFRQPAVTRVSGLSWTLHKSLVWGQAESEMAESTGVKHSDPPYIHGRHHTVLMGKLMIHFQFPTLSSTLPF